MKRRWEKVTALFMAAVLVLLPQVSSVYAANVSEQNREVQTYTVGQAGKKKNRRQMFRHQLIFGEAFPLTIIMVVKDMNGFPKLVELQSIIMYGKKQVQVLI